MHAHTHIHCICRHFAVPSCTDAYKLAEAIYASTLHHRKKADTIRNALAVLQKYRFLFNLPRSIERSISNVCGREVGVGGGVWRRKGVGQVIVVGPTLDC